MINAKKIIIFVIGKIFIYQYNNECLHGVLLSKYKNAIIKYYIVDFDLKINDLLDIDLKMDE